MIADYGMVQLHTSTKAIDVPDKSSTGKRVRERQWFEPNESIVTSSDLKRLRLLNVALRAWELRNGFPLLIAGMFLLSPANAQTVECGECHPTQRQIEWDVAESFLPKVADDESPCGPYVNDMYCDGSVTMSEERFYSLFPDADEDDYTNYVRDSTAWLRSDYSSNAGK